MVVIMTESNLVFVSSYGSRYDLFEATAFTIVIIYLIINLNKVENKAIKIYYKVFLVFLFILIYDWYDHVRVKDMVENAIKTETYKVVQGKIKNYNPMYSKAGHLEAFDIGSIHFVIYPTEFGSYKKNLFYTTENTKSMPIHKNGQEVKVHYITIYGENKIIKMWVYGEDTNQTTANNQ